MIRLTTEQAQQIEEALEYARNVCAGSNWSTDDTDEALAAIREARAQEQAEQEPLMDYERINALREGEQNGAEDAYFFVRPENDTPTLRKMFCQGFERGFHKGLKYASPVRTKDLTDEEQLELARSSVGKSRHWLVAAVIAADREKNRA